MDCKPELLKVLIVEDDDRDAELIAAALQAYGYQLIWQQVSTEAEFEAEISADLDVILCDHSLPAFSPRRAIELLRARRLPVPLIVVSGSVSETEAMEALRLGAEDYLLKDSLVRLGAAVSAAVQRSRMAREVRAATVRAGEMRERLRSFMDHSPAFMFMKDRSGAYLIVNREFVRSLDLAEEEIVGKRDTELFTPEVAAQFTAHDREVLSVGEPMRFEETSQQADGVHEHLVVKFPLRDGNGEIYGTGGIATDITDRKRIEERYRATFAQAAVGIAHFTPDWRFIEVNDTICRQLGYACEELLTMCALDLVHPGDRNASKMFVEQLLASDAKEGPGRELRLITAERRSIWVSLAVSVVRPVHGVPYFVAVVQDVSERKRAEARAALLQTATIAVSESLDLRAALRLVLRRICEAMGWPYGQACLMETNENRVECAVAWHDGSPALEQFHRSAPAIDLRHDSQGLAATVYHTQRPLLVPDLDSAGFRQREAAVERGFKSWIGIPVLADARTVALLEFYLFDAREEHREQMEVVAVVAKQLGMVFERKAAQERLAYLAHHDPLTNLPNRVLFNDRLQHTLAQAQRNQRTVAVFMLDIDRFSAVNEALGHTVADEVLRRIAARISSCIRAGDTAARLSGDEFSVILSEVAEAGDAALVAEKMLSVLSAPVEIRGETIYTGASIGIALYPGDHSSGEGLIQRAEDAMDRAKSGGRGRYHFYAAEMDARARERIQLEQSLRGAVQRGEFLLLFQPKLEIATCRLVGLEALLRWKPETGGLVAPDRFIPALEDSGLIVEVGAWVVRAACSQMRSWIDADLSAVPVAVNVSAKQLDRGFVDYVSRTLEEFALQPSFLELEITESSVMQNPIEAVKTLTELRKLGVSVSMDDFGTGHSSLSYLRRLPVDCVKIDRSFVTDIETNPGDAAIAQAIINLAHHLGLRVVAEGVETQAQLSMLAANGCDQMQGYLFAPPLAAADVVEMLRCADGRPWAELVDNKAFLRDKTAKRMAARSVSAQ